MALSISVKADSKFPIDRARLRRVLSEAWEKQGLNGNVNVSVAVVGRRKMVELEKKFRKKEGPTNVLAFPQQSVSGAQVGFVTQEEGPLELGDIVICYPLAIEEAAQMGVLVDDRIEELALHGFYNLLGKGEEHDILSKV